MAHRRVFDQGERLPMDDGLDLVSHRGRRYHLGLPRLSFANLHLALRVVKWKNEVALIATFMRQQPYFARNSSLPDWLPNCHRIAIHSRNTTLVDATTAPVASRRYSGRITPPAHSPRPDD